MVWLGHFTIVLLLCSGTFAVPRPPKINMFVTSNDTTVTEGGNITLVCLSRDGEPRPNITWRREDRVLSSWRREDRTMRVRMQHGVFMDVKEYLGENLHLHNITRHQMGTFLCTASNNVPPAASKRVALNVNFPPTVFMDSPLVGRTIVVMRCYIEAFPKAIIYWQRKDHRNITQPEIIMSGSSFLLSANRTGYKTVAELRILNYTEADAGTYECVSTNSLGRNQAVTRLHVSDFPITTTTRTTTGNYLYTGPYFDPSTLSNVTAQLGDTAQLPCRVRQIGTKTVAWIRKFDAHILTVDKFVFTSDERFMVIRSRRMNDFDLIIRNVHEKDEGTYECTISTEPQISHSIYLKVTDSARVPTTTTTTRTTTGSQFYRSATTVQDYDPPYISMEQDVSVNGKKVRAEIICSVGSKTRPDFSWYKDGFLLDVSSFKFMGSSRESTNNFTTFTLVVNNVSVGDYGNYSCVAENNVGTSRESIRISDRTKNASLDEPYFDMSAYGIYGKSYGSDNGNVTSVEGQTTYLHCKVYNLGFRKSARVAWINLKTWSYLSVGENTSTSDERISVMLSPDTWTLIIRNTTKSDMGEYMCRASHWTFGKKEITLTLRVEGNLYTNLDQLNGYKDDSLPQLDKSQSGNVTAVLDETATLNCRVKFIGNKTVSWIRHSDLHLLTAGRNTYTSDSRFRAIHKVHSEDYLLHINPVLMRDAGLYECQISTTPIITHYVFLDVIETPHHSLRTTDSTHRRTPHHPLQTTESIHERITPLRTTTTHLPPPRSNQTRMIGASPRRWTPALRDFGTITRVTPHQVNIGTTTMLHIELPLEAHSKLPAHYLCRFTALGKTMTTNSSKTILWLEDPKDKHVHRMKNTSTGVSCSTPSSNFLPSIPLGETHFKAKLSLVSLDGSYIGIKPFENLTFYDCSAHSSCTSCVSSPFHCDWCIKNHRCSHDADASCHIPVWFESIVRNDNFVSDGDRISNGSIRSRPGPGFCPSIRPIDGEPAEIFVAHESSHSIKVEISNNQPFMNDIKFVCQFNIEGRLTTVNADGPIYDADGLFITCSNMNFSYTSRSPQSTASLDIIWEGHKRLDNPSNLRVTMYKCEHLSTSCGTCATKEMFQKFKCGWCANKHTCSLWSDGSGCSSDSWILNTTNLCPTVVSKTPPNQPAQTLSPLHLEVEHMPIVPDRLKCVYQYPKAVKSYSSRGYGIYSASARRKAINESRSWFIDGTSSWVVNGSRIVAVNGSRTVSGVTCHEGHLDPDFVASLSARKEQEMTSSLSIQTADGREVASTDFTFFNCGAFSSCTSCVSSRFQCDFCYGAEVCTFDSRISCPNDTNTNTIITGISKMDPGINSGPSFCPTFRPRNSGPTKILVPYGSKKSIQVNVDILLLEGTELYSDTTSNKTHYDSKSHFICDFTIDQRHRHQIGQLNTSSNILTCNAMNFTFSPGYGCDYDYCSETAKSTAQMTVRTVRDYNYWGSLDNPENINIEIYRCNWMGRVKGRPNCNKCLELDRKYQCGWCQASKTCEVADDCKTGATGLDWIPTGGNQTCPEQGASVG